MHLKDTNKSYGEISLLNHWLVAIFTFVLLTLGLVYDGIPKSEARESIINWHASIGLLAIPFVIWRITWRVKSGFPKDEESSIIETKIKRAMHILLLIVIGLQIITGPMYLWTEAEALPFFGLFEIPSPFSAESEWLHESAEAIHKYAANPLLIVLLSLHFLAALKSIFWDKRKTFVQK
jgi:cytochrome b561